MDGLPYREIWAVDFEYISTEGNRPVPVCMVAKELRAGRLLRLWQDELPRECPIPSGDDVLFVAYQAAAELSCYLVLGWALPTRILDPYVEFLARTNYVRAGLKTDLLTCLSFHGLPSITKAEKQAGRALVMRGGPWTAAERTEVLDYCQSDVDPLGPLLARMLPSIRTAHGAPRPEDAELGFGQALLRGRYMAAVARMEHAGIPVDTELLNRLRAHWSDLKSDLVTEMDRDYHVYEGVTFKRERFAKWLADQGMAWPLNDRGDELSLTRKTFRDMSKVYPAVGPLKELRHALSDLRLERLAVGEDGRNRTSLMPFGQRPGRNNPGATKWLLGPSVWLRGLIRPVRGQALAYIDWDSQEFAMAAALSGDAAMLAAAQSSDPYMAFAKLAGLAPEDATKTSHPQVREQCKQCVLGTNYGMQAASLAIRIGGTVADAERLLRARTKAFPVFAQWAQDTIFRGMLDGWLSSVYGWPLRAGPDTGAPSLMNFPMQSNGAEMLRVACCLATEREVKVCAPLHDALFIEAPADDIRDAVGVAQQAMKEASSAVLGGLEIGSSAELVTWPGRYADSKDRGKVMWERVNALLSKHESPDESRSRGCGGSGGSGGSGGKGGKGGKGVYKSKAPSAAAIM